MTSTRYALSFCLALAAAGCGSGATEPALADTAQLRPSLNFLRPAPDSPALARQSVSFHAVQGQDREASIWYHARVGASDSTEFLNFEVPANAQMTLPNGTQLSPGDSVLITITVTDMSSLIANFQPAGLRFGSGDVAELEMTYAEQDDDIDDDGDVDADDDEAELSLSLYRQETVGAPWLRIAGTVTIEGNEVGAKISGFTNYVIAY